MYLITLPPLEETWIISFRFQSPVQDRGGLAFGSSLITHFGLWFATGTSSIGCLLFLPLTTNFLFDNVELQIHAKFFLLSHRDLHRLFTWGISTAVLGLVKVLAIFALIRALWCSIHVYSHSESADI